MSLQRQIEAFVVAFGPRHEPAQFPAFVAGLRWLMSAYAKEAIEEGRIPAIEWSIEP